MEYGRRDHSGNSQDLTKVHPGFPGTWQIYSDSIGHLEYSQFLSQKYTNEPETYIKTRILTTATKKKFTTFCCIRQFWMVFNIIDTR